MIHFESSLKVLFGSIVGAVGGSDADVCQCPMTETTGLASVSRGDLYADLAAYSC